ncbi:hypothetical protein PSP31120_03709 [Pandoraea sputorum]|nr:hypothetical protein PSP31120_03709 [Pandoraea sputorum]
MAGCASSTATYDAPVAQRVESTSTVDAKFDATWDRLVKNLASDFFVINNIDKNSRLLNISFSADKPSEYIDCGVSHRTFKNVRGESTYAYQTADSSTYTATNSSNVAYNVRRQTRVDGRVNVYVAPEGDKTSVSVNAKYVLTIDMAAAPLGGGLRDAAKMTADLSTKQPYMGADFSCVSRGVIERRIIEAASK